MRKLDQTEDYSGRALERGDMVSTLNGQLTGRISDIAADGETIFVRLRPLHQPYGKGTWHAADRLIWVAAANRRKRKGRSDNSDDSEKSDNHSTQPKSTSSVTDAEPAGS